ncbi:nicotinamide riboside transporter PnuC [Helicobacter pametensis]|uniref:nicotinamide riboside transporter PnuC n=1 Tax=Helicobacter pametensis TaxID=95149 RepID=UPI0004889306|nr:nicotinamide riboside transporter PnuC [Helicobacter pametensis]
MLRLIWLSSTNLSAFFYVVLCGVCVVVAWISYWSGSSTLGIFVAILGILYAFFAGEGRLVCFVFGIIYSILYAYIAFDAKLYGDVMLNLLYLPINILGLWTWRRSWGDERVVVRTLGVWGMSVCVLGVLILSVGYGVFLDLIGSSLAYWNALSVVLQILAFYLQAKCYVQNYLLVSIANVISILMWWMIYHEDSNALPQLLNMLVFLGIGLWYWRIWSQEVGK